MQVSWYAHLPGVSASATERVMLEDVELVALPLQEWRRLDDSFPFDDDKYERARPIFLHGRLPEPDSDTDPQGLLDRADSLSDEFYQAFLLLPGAPVLPAPRLSIRYIAFKEAGEVVGHIAGIGALEREWLVFGSKLAYEFTAEHLHTVAAMLRLLRAVPESARPAGVDSGLATLELTARPEFWWDEAQLDLVNSYVYTITAIENCLLPERNQRPQHLSLTELFGRNTALLLARSWQAFHDARRPLSDHYRLRSRLIHGVTGVDNLTDPDVQLLEAGRNLLGSVVLTLLALARAGVSATDLWSLLAEAAGAEQSFERLQQRIQAGFEV